MKEQVLLLHEDASSLFARDNGESSCPQALIPHSEHSNDQFALQHAARAKEKTTTHPPSPPASNHPKPSANPREMDPSSTILALTLLPTLLALLAILTFLYRRYWSEWLWRIYHHHPRRRGAAADDEERIIGGCASETSSSSDSSAAVPGFVPGAVPVMFPTAPVFATW